MKVEYKSLVNQKKSKKSNITFRRFNNVANARTEVPDAFENVIPMYKFMRDLKDRRELTDTIKSRDDLINEFIAEARSEIYGLPDWNGYGAEPLSPISIEYASQFLKSLPDNIPLPEGDPNPNGLLGLYWSNEQYKLILDINENSIISYAFKSKKGLTYTGRPKFYSSIPKRLNSLLSDYFSE